MINNEIKNSRGQTIGFRCSKCNEIFDKMWSNICNLCRDDIKKHNELLEQIKQLKEIIKNK